MVIDATAIFSCHHEFIERAGVFLCHKCNHSTAELPIASWLGKAAEQIGQDRSGPRLLLFPVPKIETKERRVG
jgi:hypothetical protein